MSIDLRYPQILEYVTSYKSAHRSESAAFLIWYLINYYRLDELEGTDCVCDQSGDKGIDGIYVNESAGTIDIFQSKISQKSNSSIGDTQLKEFAGTLSQFETAEALQNLLDSAGDVQVAALIKRLDLLKRLQDYTVRGVFLANLDLDSNGIAFLKSKPGAINFVGISELQSSYVSDAKDAVQTGKAIFDIFGLSAATYVVDKDTTATIAPVLASDLVKLSGIVDQALFSVNVRASLGNTTVNKAIAKSVQNTSLHKAFPLFHNGITVLAKTVQSDEKSIQIEDYFVVNGCQSLNTLYANRDYISGDLRVLTKFIQVQAGSNLADLITTYSNNQNGVKARDFKSNHPIQTRLQNEFRSLYQKSYAFEVKRGEPVEAEITISNEEAGLLLVAFDLLEPWATHRKYQVFDDRYAAIFGRPDVTADKIVFVYEIGRIVSTQLPKFKNDLIAKYVLTKYVIVSAVKRLLEYDEIGKDMLTNPANYVRDGNVRARFIATIDIIVKSLIIDFDVDTADLPDDFDYRGKLRDKEYVSVVLNDLFTSYRKDLLRNKTLSVADAWKSFV